MDPDLTPDAIASHCRSPAAAAVAIEVVAETGSTNADLLARISGAAPAGIEAPTLLVARRQTAGRGRAGRVWQSDASSLTFSLAWRFERPLAALVGLPLAVGVAIADVLAARGVPIGLKWPNDILLDGAKLAGILTETVRGASLLRQDTWAVVGVGMNLHGTDTGFAPAGTVAALPRMDRDSLMAALLDALAATLASFAESGLTPFVARWNAMHAHAGRMVCIIDRGQAAQTGRALGVDGFGRLLLDTEAGTVAIVAGDVSLRPAQERLHAAAD